MIILACLALPCEALASPELGPDALRSLGQPGLAIAVDLGHASGLNPAFSASELSLSTLGFSARWSPVAPVELRLRYERLQGSWPDGTKQNGSGDIRLGTAAQVLPGRGLRPALWLDWALKMPNAADSTRLGTDETDLSAAAALRWSGDRLALTASAGLLILGDPQRYAAQDDAAQLSLSGVWDLEQVRLLGSLGGRLPSSRNAADLEARLGAELGLADQALRLGVDASLGLSPAAADWSGRVWLGWRVPIL